jgi:hypothetical protein
VLSPALAAFHAEGSNYGAIITLIIIAAVSALGLFAPTIRRSLGRGFLLLGLCFFAMPVSALLLSGRAAYEVMSASEGQSDAAAAIVSGLAGTAFVAAFTGIGTFFGVIFGVIFVVLGVVLALGGRREVIVVRQK